MAKVNQLFQDEMEKAYELSLRVEQEIASGVPAWFALCRARAALDLSEKEADRLLVKLHEQERSAALDSSDA